MYYNIPNNDNDNKYNDLVIYLIISEFKVY